MEPAGKQKPKAQGPAPAPPLLECALSMDVDLVPVVPWTAAESNEHRRTPIWPGAIDEHTASKTVYPFFLHIVFAGLVLPFSSFFTAVRNHYTIQALHLQPNYVLLGVQPSVALFRHFITLHLHDSTHSSASVSFMVA
ncbi:hypothetical protein D1007_17488 [Hordeum vulgare]|nr:hypothetical protein D1007_17488 [Hordeum vulgare]